LFQKIAQGRMYQRIVDQILASILSRELKVGEKLPSEKEMTEIFGVSRITVREALRSLEQSGVVEIRQGSSGGAFVRPVDLNPIARQMKNLLKMAHVNLSQLTAARAFFEEMVLSKFPLWKKAEKHLRELKRHVEKAEDHFRRGQNFQGYEANRDFHNRIVQTCGNPIIILEHQLISELLFEYFRKANLNATQREKTIQEHRTIIRLLEEGKYREAAQICSRHLCHFSRSVEKEIQIQSTLRKRKKGPIG
jgi:GntR family transcriptional repressor for pyruvate dehydrogenase complex